MTAGALLPYRRSAGIVLAGPGGGLFAGRRRDSAAPAWQMPQGGIDGDETPREAALRELAEETGITPDKVRVEAETRDWLHYDLPPAAQGGFHEGRFRGQRQKWVLMRFLGTDADIRIATEIPEFSAWQWMQPAALIAAIVPFKREVYRAVLAEFAPLL